MTVSKEQLVNGLLKYARAEVVNNIPDRTVKMVLAVGLKVLERKTELIDSILSHPLMKALIPDENGQYNIDDAYEIISEVLNEYGDFPITLPVVGVPIIFKQHDVDSLKSYIERGAEL